MPPYWCVKHEGPANMVRDEVDVNDILSILCSDEKKSQARAVRNSVPKFTVPIMTNIMELPAGTKLLYQPPAKVTAEEKAAKLEKSSQLTLTIPPCFEN